MEYKRGDIVWGRNSHARYSVQGGGRHGNSRPYLIISNNYCNENSPTVTAVPFTTAKKEFTLTHHKIKLMRNDNIILVEQITCIDKRDLGTYITTIDNKDLEIIEEKIKIQLGLKGVK